MSPYYYYLKCSEPGTGVARCISDKKERARKKLESPALKKSVFFRRKKKDIAAGSRRLILGRLRRHQRRLPFGKASFLVMRLAAHHIEFFGWASCRTGFISRKTEWTLCRKAERRIRSLAKIALACILHQRPSCCTPAEHYHPLSFKIIYNF